MIIKRYEAPTQTEAMILAREELGKDAVIMNIKKIKPKGILKLFKKPMVEITAAADENVMETGDNSQAQTSDKKEQMAASASFKEKADVINGNIPSLKNEVEKTMREEEKQSTSALEEKLDSLSDMIQKQMSVKESPVAEEKEENKEKQDEEKKGIAHQCMELVKKQLAHNEVDEKYIKAIINEVENTIKPDAPVDNILTAIYQKIVLKLGQPELIKVGAGNPKYIFFMGPTGVGKTTSIAKIASDLKLNQKLNVALVTSDTYRIAAVEQLRTYANILNVPVNVIYSVDDLKNSKESLDKYDIVLVDTAGRSHRNKEQREDLFKLIDTIDKTDRALYLVLSATTKYSDLVHIVNAYSKYDDYKLIFTKLDETDTYGSILNIKMLTGASLSYSTWGQDVPHDIGRIDTQRIAKQLLGGNI